MAIRRCFPRLADLPGTDLERERFREWAAAGGRGPDNHGAWLAWLVERGKQLSPEQRAAIRTARAPVCRRCRDTGWLHPLTGGAVRWDRVLRCDCDALAREREAMRAAAPGPAVEHVAGERAVLGQRFTSYRAAPGAEAAWRAVRAWVRSPDVPWLYLQGVAGCGKTHLLQAARADLVERGEEARYISVPDWLRGMYGQSLQAASESVRVLQECRWLLLDQFGQRWSLDEVAKLEELLDRRYGALFTLIASDRAIEGCPSGRLRSRLSDAGSVRVIVSEAGDYRPVPLGARMRLPLCVEDGPCPSPAGGGQSGDSAAPEVLRGQENGGVVGL